MCVVICKLNTCFGLVSSPVSHPCKFQCKFPFQHTNDINRNLDLNSRFNQKMKQRLISTILPLQKFEKLWAAGVFSQTPFIHV